MRSVARTYGAPTVVLAALIAALGVACTGEKPPIVNEPYRTRVTAGGNIVGESEASIVQRDNVFEPSSITVDDTKYVRLSITNEGRNVHTFTIRDLDMDTGRMRPGDNKTLLFPAPAFQVTFVCKIHEDQGMTGTIHIE